jgi:hypothetical protein
MRTSCFDREVLKVLTGDYLLMSCLFSGNYRKAFLACRKHRVDLNVIVDRNPEKFMQDVPSFLDQVPEVDHINLFLTFVGCDLTVFVSFLYHTDFCSIDVVPALLKQSQKSVMHSELSWRRGI